MIMERIPSPGFRGGQYIAQIDMSVEEAERRWGPAEITTDDLGPWATYVFRLAEGAAVALVREVENAPSPGFILTASQDSGADMAPGPVLAAFLAEGEISEDHVLHRGLE